MHSDGGRCEGVVWGEDERAPVLAAGVGCVGRASEDVVPLENVAVRRVGDDEFFRLGLEVHVFLSEPAGGLDGCHGFFILFSG